MTSLRSHDALQPRSILGAYNFHVQIDSPAASSSTNVAPAHFLVQRTSGRAHKYGSTDVLACAKHCNFVRASQGTLEKFSVCETTLSMQPGGKTTARGSTLLSVRLHLSCNGVCVGCHFGPNSSQSCARGTWLGPMQVHVLIDEACNRGALDGNMHICKDR